MFEGFQKRSLLFTAPLVLILGLFITSQGVAQTSNDNFNGVPLYPASIINQPSEASPSSPQADTTLNRPISVIVTFEETFDPQLLEIVSGGHIVHYYEQVFNGASLILDYTNLNSIMGLEGVIEVYPDDIKALHTDTSPGFIGATTLWAELGGQNHAGEGILVGIIDSGVWPEHPSFADPDPAGDPYPVPPTGNYECQIGNEAWNPVDLPFVCNNKLIGAYHFMETYKELVGLQTNEFDSARDDNGHGTLITTVAAGNGNVPASISAVNRGFISGISPRSHIIVYKACGVIGCFSSDILAAVEQSLLNNVDVINFSISGGLTPYSDPVELAFLTAYEQGIFVAASAGNKSSLVNSVEHRAPWVMTVSASTHTRTYTSSVTLIADNGDTISFNGASLTDGNKGEVVLALDYADPTCSSPFPAATFDGQIVICEAGGVSNVVKSQNVMQGGAGGIIIYNKDVRPLKAEAYYVPGIHITDLAGKYAINFVVEHGNVTAILSGGIATTSQGDVMASFSSTGGPQATIGINKPDITAPGFEILGGQTPYPIDINKIPGQLFQVADGTSMASPHIAGAAALLKALHPNWTPGQIKSALMTTAVSEGVVQADGITPATPFNYGSGRVNLNLAGNPGLTFSTTAEEFLLHKYDLWNVNYPSLYIPTMTGIITVGRTLESVLPVDSIWMTSIAAPSDLTLSLRPTIPMRAGMLRPINIFIDASLVPVGEVRHATIFFTSGDIVVKFPVTVVRTDPVIVVDKVCEPGTFVVRETADCTITMTNTTPEPISFTLYDKQPRILQLVPGTVNGATPLNERTFVFTGTLSASEPPSIELITGTTPANGYLPLSQLGIPPIGGVTDETLLNFAVPSFIYNGETYTTIKMTSNGYLVAGSGSNSDLQFLNQSFPDAANPNNVIAPFWTDLNPLAGGAMRAAFVNNANNELWLVFEWENVPNFSDGSPNSFQVWIGANGIEDISIAYGPVISSGSNGLLTIGAEDATGVLGGNWYTNGQGTVVQPGDQLRVVTDAGNPGGTHTVTYSVMGWHAGLWTNCAQTTSNVWAGISMSCFGGEVLP